MKAAAILLYLLTVLCGIVLSTLFGLSIETLLTLVALYIACDAYVSIQSARNKNERV